MKIQQMNKTGKIILYSSIGLVVLLVVLLTLEAMKKRSAIKLCEEEGGNWNKKTKQCDFDDMPDSALPPPNSTSVSGNNSSQVIEWKPNALASEIASKLEGYNLSTYPEVADKILALTDQQLKSLYTYYNKYKAKDYPTLTKLFANEWSDWGGKYDLVVNRLEGLNLR